MSAYEMKSMSEVHVGTVGEGNTGGYGPKQNQVGLRRVFSWTQMFFFALSYMSSWEAVAANLALVFSNGGPRAIVWGFFIIVPGVLCQVASLSEMASLLPIAGVQYHFTWELAPKKYRRFLTWIQGWVTWFSWVSLLAGIVNIVANHTMTLAKASYPAYVEAEKSWHVILVMYAYSIALSLLNMYAFFLIPWLELMAGILHICLWVIFVVVLLVLAPRHSDHFVWLEGANNSGWNSDFVNFNIGTIFILWGFVGFDASAHISEETRKARSAIPQTMFWGIVINAGLAFGFTLVMLYTCGDPTIIANSVVPLYDIARYATGSVSAASTMLGFQTILTLAGTLGSIASASRITWAWARDGGLPSYFAYISPRFRIPVRSVWLPVVFVMILSLLNLTSWVAFSIITTLSTLGLYQSYFIAIACMLNARLKGTVESPWSLGKWGVAINVFGLVYTAWMCVWLCFPMGLPITVESMNYGLPIVAFVWLFAIVAWFAYARKNWPGLNTQVIKEVVADGDRDTKDL